MEGIKRLQELVKGQEDSALNQVVDYLCTRKDLSNKYLNPEKDLKGMAKYIKEKAMVNVKNGWNFFNDKVVYSWAVTYFLVPNSSLGIKEQSSKKEQKSKTSKKASTTQNQNTTKVISFDKAKNKSEQLEQITLFGGAV